jgi:hypothetical protein
MASADAGPYAGTDPREKWDRPQLEEKLAEPCQAVKCLENPGRNFWILAVFARV